mgnify:CR=1 FL=1
MRIRLALAPVSLLLTLAPPLPAQTACQFSFAASSSTATAAGSGPNLIVQRLDNQNPADTGCPSVLEPAAPWVRVLSHAAGPAASTEFRYRVLENFERSPRTALLRANGAVHQIQQSAGPHQGRAPRMAVRGSDGLARIYEYGAAGAVTAAGMPLDSDPSIGQGSGCEVELVARDTQGQLAANTFNGCTNQWLGWRNFGGSIRGRPALALQPSGSVIAPVHDISGSYFLRRYQVGQSGGDWLPIGGLFVSDPAAAADATGQVYILGKDLWNALWVGRVNSAGQFLGWTFAGGIVRGAPSLAAGSDGILYAAARDPWGGLHLLRVKDSSILGWSRAEVTVASDPQITAPGDGMVYLAALNSSGSLVYGSFAEGTAQGWGPWTNAGGSWRHVAAAGLSGEPLFAIVDSSSRLLWYRPATAEWKSFGVLAAGAGRPGAAP